jgi:hypothetical protein
VTPRRSPPCRRAPVWRPAVGGHALRVTVCRADRAVADLPAPIGIGHEDVDVEVRELLLDRTDEAGKLARSRSWAYFIVPPALMTNRKSIRPSHPADPGRRSRGCPRSTCRPQASRCYPAMSKRTTTLTTCRPPRTRRTRSCRKTTRTRPPWRWRRSACRLRTRSQSAVRRRRRGCPSGSNTCSGVSA